MSTETENTETPHAPETPKGVARGIKIAVALFLIPMGMWIVADFVRIFWSYLAQTYDQKLTLFTKPTAFIAFMLLWLGIALFVASKLKKKLEWKGWTEYARAAGMWGFLGYAGISALETYIRGLESAPTVLAEISRLSIPITSLIIGLAIGATRTRKEGRRAAIGGGTSAHRGEGGHGGGHRETGAWMADIGTLGWIVGVGSALLLGVIFLGMSIVRESAADAGVNGIVSMFTGRQMAQAERRARQREDIREAVRDAMPENRVILFNAFEFKEVHTVVSNVVLTADVRYGPVVPAKGATINWGPEGLRSQVRVFENGFDRTETPGVPRLSETSGFYFQAKTNLVKGVWIATGKI